MLAKKVTALLVSAALVLTLLAGCGNGSKALSQVFVDLLQGQYANLTVEIDPDLEAALKKAVAAGDTDQEILDALIEELNLTGKALTLSRSSFDGAGEGEQAVDLTFQPGEDETTAARNALNSWLSVLGSLPADGRYTANLTMVKTEGGYYVAVRVTVDQAGRYDDQDEPEQPKDPYTVQTDESGNITGIIVNTSEGLNQVFNEQQGEDSTLTTARENGFSGVTIKLKAEQTYTISSTIEERFQGTLQSDKEGSNAIIVLEEGSRGLFERVGKYGYIKNMTIQVNGTISNTVFNYASNLSYTGAVSGINSGTITDCQVDLTDGSISATDTEGIDFVHVGGIVGSNSIGSKISNCTVLGGTITAQKTSPSSGFTSAVNAGGIAGSNIAGICEACTVQKTRVEAINEDNAAYAGGIAGQSYDSNSIVEDNNVYDAVIYANGYIDVVAGGIVGYNASKSDLSGNPATNTSVTAETKDGSVTVPDSNGNNADTDGAASAGTLAGRDGKENGPTPSSTNP